MPSIIVGHRGWLEHIQKIPVSVYKPLSILVYLGWKWMCSRPKTMYWLCVMTIQLTVAVMAKVALMSIHSPNSTNLISVLGLILVLRAKPSCRWESCSLAAEHDLGLNIEVKVDKHDVASVVQPLKAQLDKSPLVADKILLSSFSHNIILQLHQHCPGYKLGILCERLTQQDREVLKEVNAFSCNLNYRWITENTSAI